MSLLPPEWVRSPEWFLLLSPRDRKAFIKTLENLVRYLQRMTHEDSVIARDLAARLSQSATPSPEEVIAPCSDASS